ncbi:hypothetical protein CFE70_002850 [Pyrenophora teres f. teres 0-1]|uniref:Uncharacterized protein n=2 Tax=Pyrenophora teres f. teres TaxID=97479 RepID=E3RKQ6_PYRTT|nr:hypothetical protein PTT_08843 [Pyrenophora teres f. teres 0-1]
MITIHALSSAENLNHGFETPSDDCTMVPQAALPRSRPNPSRRTTSSEFDCRTRPTALTTENPQALNPIDCLTPFAAFTMPVIDTRWSHRVGSPALTVPPFKTVEAQTIPKWKDVEFRSEIVSILDHAQVRVLGYGLVRRVRPGQEVSQTPLTLLVISDASIKTQYAAWEVAVRHLRSLFDNIKREDIIIEISDIKTAHEVVSAPLIGCTPELINAWHEFQPFLLREIDGQEWLAVDIVHREIGDLYPVSAPTLFITARDADLAIWWDIILPRLRERLPSPMELDLLYSSHLTLRTPSDEQVTEDSGFRPSIYSTMQDYDRVVQMGSSIGVDQPANSGTVSAVIRLRDANGKETECALTNHHVVATCEAKSIINKQIPAGQFLGLDHKISRLGLVKIVAPSHKDHDRFLEYKTMEKKEHDEVLATFQNQHLYGYPLAHRNVIATDSDWVVLNSMPDRLLGTVLASSGYRTCNNTDYTLAETKSFSKVIHVPNYAFRYKDGTMPLSLAEKINGRTLDFGLNWAVIKLAKNRTLSDRTPPRSSGVKIPTRAQVGRYAHIRHNVSYNVAKKGRTTGWTYGKVSEIGSLLNLRPADGTSIIPVDLADRYGQTNAIMLAFGVIDDRKREEFMSSGDSGSCVLLNESNPKATIVGLLYASNEYTHVSYMIPFDFVVRDIEHVTGQTVVQPEFVDYDTRG